MRNLLAGFALALTLASCDSGSTPVEPESSRSAGSALLAVEDLPDGYVISPPQAAPEVSEAGSVSVAGCDTLIDRFRGGGGDGVRFEGGAAGPFLAEEVSDAADAVDVLRGLAARCAAFTDTDAGGETTSVTVAEAGLPPLGNASVAVRMAATGGSGDAAYTLSGYLLAVRVGARTCTIVHFGQPEVDPAETETIARAAVRKLQRPQ